jgi:crossover junction endodeoxyribonuclease RusA
MIISERGRKYRIDVLEAVLKQRAVKHLEKDLKINIVVTRPDNRRRDLDNLTKALLDGLTHAGLWEDDSQIVDLHIAWSKKDGNECAEVMVEVEEYDDE